MDFFFPHQQDSNYSLFGLLGNRFLFKGPPGKRPRAHKIPTSDVEVAKWKKNKEYAKYMKRLKNGIKDYNKRYGEDAGDVEDGSHIEDIKLYPKEMYRTKYQIDKIMKVLSDVAEEDGGTNWRAKLKNRPQYKILSQMKEVIDTMPKLKQALSEGVETAHRGRLAKRHESLTKAKEQKKGWLKRPAYHEVSKVFDTLAASDKFKNIFQSPEGIVTQNQREAKELFFAIVAEKTNDFKSTFVLGKSFSNDVKNNIRNFPFIYNAFLEHEGGRMKLNVSTEKIETAQSAAEEADRKLVGITDVNKIISSNASGGTVAPAPVPATPNTPAWRERSRVLKQNIYNLEKKAAKNKKSPHATGWTKAANDLTIYKAQADAYLQLSRLKDREMIVQQRFTRAELSKPARRKTVIEFAMKKTLKAMDMVDSPFGNAKWQQMLHPTVRRMLIASIYEGGVATYKKDAAGNVTYEDNIKGDTTWMLSALALSDYFNFKEVGDHMDADHAAVLKAAYVGSRIATVLKNVEAVEEVLAAWIKVRNEAGTKTEGEERDKFIEEGMEGFESALVKRFSKYKDQELIDTQDDVQKTRVRLDEFLKRTRSAIEHPYTKKSKEFIEAIKSGRYKNKLASDLKHLGALTGISGEDLEAYEAQMYNLQINFKTAELQDKNELMFFEGLGMNIEGIEQAYLEAIKEDSDLRVEYWDDLLLGDDDEFNKLIVLFQNIIPPNIAGGKADFIAGLKSLRKKYKGEKSMTRLRHTLKEGSEDAIILNVFRTLQIHMRHRAETAAFGARKQKEIQAKLNGMHLGDKVSKYVGGVIEMLIGPGQSPVNRGVGFALLYMGYKAARKAIKGEGSMGKMLRAVFVGGAIEIAMKEITGRGILDRAGLDSIAGSMERTYAGVLLQDAEKNMDDKDITPEAHSAALFELNDVPFHQVMEWYESSDDNGMPRTKGAKDYFPRQINLNKIGPKVTWEAKDKKMEARRVVWETVRHFFTYVGEKANKRGHDHGKEALKERWVIAFDKKGYKSKFTTYTHRKWIEKYNVKKGDITWLTVMNAEIDPHLVKLTEGKTTVGKLEATAKDWYSSLSDWTREYVYNPGSGYAEQFFEDLGEGAQDAKNFFSDVAKDFDRKIYFGKEKVILWYGAHQYEIRRGLGNHWNLLVTGVKLPFKLVYAVDNWAIPWTLARLRMIEGSLRSDKITYLDPTDTSIDAFDIASGPDTINNQNTTINPEYRYYGKYQEHFLNALTDSADRGVNKRKPWYYEDTAMNVGYFISEVSATEAGVNQNDPMFQGKPGNVHDKIIEKSYRKAEKQFYKQGLDKNQIEDHMFRIHKIVKTTNPKKVYIFWRMPLKDSMELEMKESGRWADYMNPNKNKDRDTFRVDPSQSSFENLKEAFMLDTGPLRKGMTMVGKYAIQLPKFAFWGMSGLGGVVKGIGRLFHRGPEFEAAVDGISEREPATQQFLDEVSGSAMDKNLAISDFYKDENNAKLFRFAQDYSQTKGKPLFLGFFEGEPGYEGIAYLTPPDNNPQAYYRALLRYYEDNYESVPNKRDDDIKNAIEAMITP